MTDSPARRPRPSCDGSWPRCRSTPTVGHSLTVAAAGERYQRHLKRGGRKRSTIAAVGVRVARAARAVLRRTRRSTRSGTRTSSTSSPCSRARGSRRSRSTTTSGRSRHCSTTRSGPQRRWAAVNPCDGVELPGVPEHDEIRFLDEAEWEAVLRHVQPGPYAGDRPGVLPDRDHGRAPSRRADRAPVARRRLGREARPGEAELRARRVRHAEVAAGRHGACRWPTGSPASSTGSTRRMGEPDDDALVFAGPDHG